MCLAKLRSVGSDGRQLSQVIASSRHAACVTHCCAWQQLFDNVWDDMMIEIRDKGVWRCMAV